MRILRIIVASTNQGAGRTASAGVQQLPFNTIYQLVAAKDTVDLMMAETLLLIPDLLAFWLTGSVGAERTNASTTGLLNVHAHAWDTPLAQAVGIPPAILPALRQVGDPLGTVLPEVASAAGLPTGVPVIAVGSPDTASAIVVLPDLDGDESPAYISGTWSLVGLELDGPVLTDEARLANFSNEVGVDGTTRFLKNVMGLWVLTESMRAWGVAASELPSLLDAASVVEPLRTVIDIDDPPIFPPGDMPARISRLASAAGEPVPCTPAHVVRCILDSLALAYRRRLRQAANLAGQDVTGVHLVGGGARNALLAQLTADACVLPVLAGPVERQPWAMCWFKRPHWASS